MFGRFPVQTSTATSIIKPQDILKMADHALHNAYTDSMRHPHYMHIKELFVSLKNFILTTINLNDILEPKLIAQAMDSTFGMMHDIYKDHSVSKDFSAATLTFLTCSNDEHLSLWIESWIEDKTWKTKPVVAYNQAVQSWLKISEELDNEDKENRPPVDPNISSVKMVL